MTTFSFFASWSLPQVLRRVGFNSGGRRKSARRLRKLSLRVEGLEDRLTPSKVSLAGGLLDANRLLDPTAAGGLLIDSVTGHSPHNSQPTGHVALSSGAAGNATGSSTLTNSSSTSTAMTGQHSTTTTSSSTSSTAAADYLVASASFYASSPTTSTTPQSSSAASTIVAPTNLTAAAKDTSQITLTWQDNSTNESGFKIYRSTDGVSFSRIATVGANVTSYTNTGLTAGTTYYYEVKAYIKHGDSSAYSNVASDVARGAATHFQVSAPTSVTAGTAFTFTVDAMDKYNRIAAGYRGIASFSSSDGKAVLPANYTFTSSDLGVHSFSATLNTAGTQSLTATDTATSSITGAQSGITVSLDDPLVISGLASTQTAGTAGSFTVTATDAAGNVVTGYTGTVTFSSSDGQAVLSANYTFTSADQGVHTFNVTFKTAGTQSLTVTDVANTSNTTTQSGITVNRAAARSLSVAGFPSPTTVGTLGSFTVTAKDAYGNVATGYTSTVKFTSSDPAAALPVNYSFTSADAGVHTFTAILNTAGTQSITCTDTVTATITGTQSNITVNVPAAGTTYYVSTTGSDSNAGTLSKPFATLAKGTSVLKPGDILYVRAGTYAENLVDKLPSGTKDAPITVAAYPGESVTVRPGSGNFVLRIQGAVSYVTIDGLILDGTGTASANVYIVALSTGTPSHITIRNSEIENAGTQGIIVECVPGYATPDYNQFVNDKIHDNGSTDFNHGLYIQSSYNLIDGVDVYRNAGWGMQIYMETGVNGVNAGHNTVRNSMFHDNARVGGRGVGIGVYKGDDNLVYNNLVWNNKVGISVDYGATNSKIFNNVVYANLDVGFRIGYNAGATNTTIQNNIIFQNTNGDIQNYGTGTVANHNLLNTTNPLFVDAANHDFHLQTGSPAIDAGITLTAVPTDFDDITRPQGLGYDIGAYEYH